MADQTATRLVKRVDVAQMWARRKRLNSRSDMEMMGGQEQCFYLMHMLLSNLVLLNLVLSSAFSIGDPQDILDSSCFSSF
jgi:hypothetical protein